MTSKDIRISFLRYFKEKQHVIVPSSPMVVKNDPTLMFTNAGMNQFKDWFLGNAPAQYKRVADTQKCLRVSGKHNDLEEVGHDTYHHTMFEMLGNWSFGNYFKKEAIEWAWEYLTDVLKIDKNRLYATVCEASPEDGVEMDSEAFDIWKQYLPEDRILVGKKKDNFWEMGDTGPCGPCSEIHYDSRSDEERAKVPGRERVNADDPQVIEIWNLVFIQYNRKVSGELEQLAAKHVDTGMGFERLCRIVQGKTSNYDTDVFQPIITKIGELCGKRYGDDTSCDVAMRVVADHLRAISFSIADGQLPSNVKAGYVIRRILRRAVRYGYTFLGFNEPFICRLVPTLTEQMGDAFPELKAQQTLIEKVIREEEQAFLRTLEVGIRLLDSIIEKLKKSGTNEISGKDAFQLYDTFGFPIDLTELIAREKNFAVNNADFEQELEIQKNRSRNAAAKEEGDWTEVRKIEQSVFVGYDTTGSTSYLARYRTVKTKGKEFIQVVLDETPFYAESGGQVGDCGTLRSQENGETIQVLNTIKENNLSIHLVEKLPQQLTAPFTATVDVEKRMATACNHTATHLIHYALRKVLGTHVEQKGSLVHADYLRFDFSHFQKVTDEELEQVERLANRLVRKNTTLTEFRNIPIAEAQQMGAMALFGEKYGETVRVIRFDDSVELCGGTHVPATGNIGVIKIVSESAVGAGVRRIEAVTADKAEEYLYDNIHLLKMVHELFSNSPNLIQAIKKTIEENGEFSKQIQLFMRERIASLKERLKDEIEEINGIQVIRLNTDVQAEAVKELATQMRTGSTNLLFVAGTIHADKPNLVISLSDDLVKKGLNAGAIVREAAKEIGGSGGGQAFLAMAGGKQTDSLVKAINKAVEIATKM